MRKEGEMVKEVVGRGKKGRNKGRKRDKEGCRAG